MSMSHARGDAKRSAIVKAATEAFLSNGYAVATMDAIAADAHVSKRTVYNNFPSKRDLFRAVVAVLYSGLNRGDCARMGVDQPPSQVLPDFARHVLSHLRHPEIMGLLRLVIAEHHRFPELGLDFHTEGKGPAVALLEVYLAAQRDAGRLCLKDPWLAATQFLGAVKEGVYWPALLGLPVPDDDTVIAAAVDAFLTAYRIEPPR